MKKLILFLLLTAVVLFFAFSLEKQRGEIRRGAEERQATFVFSPSEKEVSPGEEFFLTLILNSGEKVAAVDLNISYPSDFLVFEEARPFLGAGEAFSDQAWQSSQEERGRIRLVLVAKRGDGELKKGTINLARLKFRARSPGTGEVTLLSTTKVLGEDNYLSSNNFPGVRVGTKGELSTPGNQVRLRLKIAFYGSLESTKPQPVKIKFQKNGWESGWFKEVYFYPEGDFYQSKAEVFPGVPPGDGYRIVIKGPKHLARSFCGEERKTVSCFSGRGTISLSDHLKTYDFSPWPLLPGDLPDPENNFLQDGVVNAVDLVLIKDRLGSTKEEDLKIADVDFSGIISGRDISLVLRTLQEEDAR